MKALREESTMSTYSGDFSEFRRTADRPPPVALDPESVRRSLNFPSTNSVSSHTSAPEDPESQTRKDSTLCREIGPPLYVNVQPRHINSFGQYDTMDSMFTQTPTEHVTSIGDCFRIIIRRLFRLGRSREARVVSRE
jgi:hypothetical protein